VRTDDSAPGLSADLRQIGEILARQQTHIDARFDRMEAKSDRMEADISVLKTDVAGLKTDVAGLKTDVAGLKTDVAGLKTDVAGLQTGLADNTARLDRMELATEKRFDRLDARLEYLVSLVVRKETEPS
jgi:predicted  nucleic acid-binding Zn-ribbon protein